MQESYTPCKMCGKRPFLLKEGVGMPISIDTKATGQQIRKWMTKRGFSVKEVRDQLSIGSVQAIYHWLNGSAMPSLDNLYALSDLLKVPIDRLIVGNREYDPEPDKSSDTGRIMFEYTIRSPYQRFIQRSNRSSSR